MNRRILAVDFDIAKFEIARLEWQKYDVLLHMVSSMLEALEKLDSEKPYALVAIFPQDNEYLAWLKALRNATCRPIIVMSMLYDGKEKMEAIGLGADEYIARPDTVEESIASCLALMRRSMEYCDKTEWCATRFALHGIFMCVEYRKVFVYGEEIDLRKKEFDLLFLFLSNYRHVLKFDFLYENAWGEPFDSEDGSANELLWSHIKRLRKKLQISSKAPNYITSVRDVGYKFDPS